MKHSHAFTPAKRRKHKPLTPALLVQLFEAGAAEPDPFYTKGTEQ